MAFRETRAFGKRFWQGAPYGFAMLTLLMAFIAALHGFSLGGWALGRGEALKYGFLYLIGFYSRGDFRRVFVSRVFAGDAGIGNRILARRNRAGHCVWGNASSEYGRSRIRRVNGRMFRPAVRAFSLLAHGNYLVRNRHARRVGLGRNVFLLRS